MVHDRPPNARVLKRPSIPILLLESLQLENVAMVGYELLKRSDISDGPSPRRFQKGRRIAWTILLVIGFVTVSLLLFPGTSPSQIYNSEETPLDDSDQVQQCASNLPLPATAPAPANVWASLSIEESVAISQWLSPDKRFNLTRADQAGLNDNIIYLIEAFRPPKAAALAYLNSPSDETLPTRLARVTIHHGAESEPYIMDYLVGPLPISEKTTIAELTDIYHRDKIPFHARGFTGMPFQELEPLLYEILTPLKEAVQV